MIHFIKVYATAFVAFLVIDLIWLGVIAKNLYQNNVGFLLKETPNWYAAVLFCLLYIPGLVFFVINPSFEKNSWQYALFAGLFLGL
jgi:uncharacterized membrane protein